MIYLDPKGLRLLSFPLFFCQQRQETREIWGRRRAFTKWKREEGGKEREECGIGVVKAASFLDIIYLSAAGPEEKEGGETRQYRGRDRKGRREIQR